MLLIRPEFKPPLFKILFHDYWLSTHHVTIHIAEWSSRYHSFSLEPKHFTKMILLPRSQLASWLSAPSLLEYPILPPPPSGILWLSNLFFSSFPFFQMLNDLAIQHKYPSARMRVVVRTKKPPSCPEAANNSATILRLDFCFPFPFFLVNEPNTTRFQLNQ